ncbi:CgeB family protein [Wenxinia marina]|uniref:Spore protein YkvP/CgeB glycosyl transferase-like domain-containing protein n=1 Tax=Wenxinia marina DSM 24838 TaxID=1123501 RepID=A0A0D0NIE1_9RHOB|nr:glycosyltransferase [Wenxinia marina]KIQ68100.1 hypothetical protein Wenmar_03315 [Wenxinia marina DSM 24838]GGL78238.1 hypothetical protein GCM10011392_35940 [Wenxinia marina]
MKRIAFYGSSLLSSYWNGAATYYRGIVRALDALGWDVTFHEPDVWDRAAHRDIDPPDWARVRVWEGSLEGLAAEVTRAADADVVIVASGIGYEDERVIDGAFSAARPDAVRVFWDVDAPATLAMLRTDADHPLHRWLERIDMVLTYGGGDAVVRAYRTLGARECVPIYNALDADIHHPAPTEEKFFSDLSFLANRLPDREARVAEFFLRPAALRPQARFLLGGSGWDQGALPDNVTALGHVGTRDHNAFNCSPRMVLNVARDSMAETGFSPATRVFEAAGAGACLVTDAWEGVETFLTPGREVLVARDGQDVADLISDPTVDAASIGAAALARVRAEHLYTHRAREVDALFARAAAETAA